MKTLDLQEAAAFLRMNPETLRQKTKAGIIPGAKPGKSWVYVYRPHQMRPIGLMHTC